MYKRQAEKKQAPLNTLLTIYFYHTRLTRESYEEWKEYKFPGHILYGLPPVSYTHLDVYKRQHVTYSTATSTKQVF